jgi:DNA-binding transcriptional MerR regulator
VSKARSHRDTGGDTRGYTVDELAGLTGVPSRTIRFYQTQGVLPAPERRGRVAVYTGDHVDRLRLIEILQSRGLRIAAIRDLVRHGADENLSVSRWLGLDERLATPWSEDAPTLVSEAELSRLSDRRPEDLAALAEAGLVRRQGNGQSDGYLVPSPGLLRVTVQLERSGIDLETATGAATILRRRLSRAADELVAHFASRVGAGFGRRVEPTEIGAALEALRPLGVEAVRLIFAQEMERSLRRRIAVRG